MRAMMSASCPSCMPLCPVDDLLVCCGKEQKIPGNVLWTVTGFKPPWTRRRAAIVDAGVGRVLREPVGPTSVLVPQKKTWGPNLAQESDDARKIQILCKERRLDRALDVLLSMDQKGTVPSVETYFRLLQLCMKNKALPEAKKVYAHLAKNGMEGNCFLDESVVNTFVKCGCLEDALQVFNRLSTRTVFSWTAVISGYCASGCAKEALNLYKHMQKEGVQPDSFTFVSLLKACGSLGDLDEGKRIHAEIVRCGYELDLFVGNTLINMYAKCGSMVEAEDVFQRLPEHNVVSWNAVIAGHAQNRQSERAVQLYGLLQREGISPDVWTFSIVLKACTNLAEKEEKGGQAGQNVMSKWLQEGKAIYKEAIRRGHGSNVFLGSTAVHMYAKSGSLGDAQDVFDTLSERDAVCWNAMLGAYVDQELGCKALQLYEQMQEEGVRPNYLTFVGALQACATLADTEESIVTDGQVLKVGFLSKGKTLLAEAAHKGCGTDLFVCNTAVHMYAKCGSVVDAEHVFNAVQDRDVVSWNAIILGCAQQQQGDKALQLYAQMLGGGVRPNDRTFVSVLKACASLAEVEGDAYLSKDSIKFNSLTKVMAIHAEAARLGFDSDLFVGNSLVNVYAKCGSMTDAQKVFDTMPECNVVTWNAMIAGYAQQQKGKNALELFAQMQEEEIRPNIWTFATVLTAGADMAELEDTCVEDVQSFKLKWLQVGKAIHAEATVQGCASDVCFGSSLVSMYAKCGSLVDAQNVFDKLPEHDVVSWNAMIGGYADQEHGDKALQVYGEMRSAGVVPDEISYLWVLKACSVTGALDVCTEIQSEIVDKGYEGSLSLATALIHAFGRCGSMVNAQKVFDALPRADLGVWTALIAGYARQGEYELSVDCFKEMEQAGHKADRLTFLAVLSACSHAGLVDEGLHFFNSMTRDYGISASTEHYVCMVDLLGRAGLFSQAEELVLRMPIEPEWAVWSSLLGACRKHGNTVLGRRAFDCLVHLDSRRASPYIVMSQIYSDARMWNAVKEISDLKRKAGVCKQPGQSWIEHEHKAHMFMVGDHRQQQYEEVNSNLEELSLLLKCRSQTGSSQRGTSATLSV